MLLVGGSTSLFLGLERFLSSFNNSTSLLSSFFSLTTCSQLNNVNSNDTCIIGPTVALLFMEDKNSNGTRLFLAAITSTIVGVRFQKWAANHQPLCKALTIACVTSLFFVINGPTNILPVEAPMKRSHWRPQTRQTVDIIGA